VRIVVVEHDDRGAAQLLAVYLLPLRLLAHLAGAVRVAGRGDADGPQVVGVLLALDDRNVPTLLAGFDHLIDAVHELRVDALDVWNPTTRTVRLTQAVRRLVPFGPAYFSKAQDAVGVAIIVGGDDIARVAVALALVLLRAAPVAVIAMPNHAPVID